MLKNDKEVLMMFRSKKFQGLRIVVDPADTVWNDQKKRKEKKPGTYVQFTNGRFDAVEEWEVEAVREYMEKHNGEIIEVDPKKLARERKIRQRVTREIAKEEAAEKKEAEKSALNAKANDRANEKIAEANADDEQKEADKDAKQAAKDQKVTDKATKQEVKKAEKRKKDEAKEAEKEAEAAQAKAEKDQKETDQASQEALEDHEEKQESETEDLRNKNTAAEKKLMNMQPFDESEFEEKSNIELIKAAEEKGIQLTGSDKRNKKSLISAIKNFFKSDKNESSGPDLTDESEEK